MKVKITRIPQDTSTIVEINKGDTVEMLLKKLHLRSNTVIVMRGKTPIPIDDVVQDDHDLRILQVASGG